MKIVFVCGSVEVSKDGVGDYIRRIAGELTRQGHEIAIMAINDKYISESVCEFQESEYTSIPVVRLSSVTSKNLRIGFAKKWLEGFEPDWVSLQFVPFSFQNKGLTIGLSSFLKKIFGAHKWHIMFHELWVGMVENATKKLVLWGWLQRQLIKSLIKRLKPAVIHTQSHLHIAHLAEYGFNALYLPLFGNIPVKEGNALKNQHHTTKNTGAGITFIHFGTIYPDAPIEDFADEAVLYAKNTNTKIKLLVIGHSGPDLDRWIRVCNQAGLEIESLGVMSEEMISKSLTSASIGITTTPFALVEKSGSVAAMREHGLPIISVAKKWKPRGSIQVKPQTEIFEYSPGNFADSITTKNNPLFVMNVSVSARQLTHTLLNADKTAS